MARLILACSEKAAYVCGIPWYANIFFGPNYNRNTSKLWCKFSSFNM